MAPGDQNGKQVKNSTIVQAGILAMAGIVSRIIGLLYRGPLTGIIGDEGNGYYTSAFNIYTIILLISSYSIPSAVSKVIAQKMAVKEYRNAHRIFICSLWYVMGVGGVASLFVLFFGDLLVKGSAVTVLRIFAPTIFFSGILGVLRGYFQAHRSMMQTSVSQILEQILNAVVSILAAFLFISCIMGSMGIYQVDKTTGCVEFSDGKAPLEDGKIRDVLGIYGEEVSEEEKLNAEGILSEEQKMWNTKHAVLGASGSALGTGAGVLAALLFMYGIYLLNRKLILKRVHRDRNSHVDSYKDILKLLLSVVTPFILSTAIYNSSTALNQTIYTHIAMDIKNVPEAEAYTLYGIYGGKAVVISNIPIALASAMSSAILPGIASYFARKEMNQARKSVSDAIKCTMLISIPAAVGLCVLARPITQVLFPQKESLEMASSLLSVLSVSVVFYALSTLTNAVLQGIGKVNIPVINTAVALMVQTVLVTVLLLTTDFGLYSLVFANVTYAVVMSLLNSRSVKKYMNYRQNFKEAYLIPLLSAVVMGAAAWGVYYGLYKLLPVNIVCLLAAIVVAVPVYFVVLLKLGGMSEEDFLHLPKGRKLLNIAKRTHLMK